MQSAGKAAGLLYEGQSGHRDDVAAIAKSADGYYEQYRVKLRATDLLAAGADAADSMARRRSLQGLSCRG